MISGSVEEFGCLRWDCTSRLAASDRLLLFAEGMAWRGVRGGAYKNCYGCVEPLNDEVHICSPEDSSVDAEPAPSFDVASVGQGRNFQRCAAMRTTFGEKQEI